MTKVDDPLVHSDDVLDDCIKNVNLNFSNQPSTSTTYQMYEDDQINNSILNIKILENKKRVINFY